MPLPSDSPPHHAWLLRCWRERPSADDQPGLWRFSLEDVHSGARLGFASLATLMAYLSRELPDDLARAAHPEQET
jgi:hypothetical protein